VQKYFFIKANGKYIKISFNEIAYVEGCRSYIKIVTDNKIHLVLLSMKKTEQIFTVIFIQAYTQYLILVSLDKIIGFDSVKVYLKERDLPIGQRFKDVLEKSVMIVNGNIKYQR
jgi:DNA-binding LytR/AlgR family response regulator